jgi:hypothetical protein
MIPPIGSGGKPLGMAIELQNWHSGQSLKLCPQERLAGNSGIHASSPAHRRPAVAPEIKLNPRPTFWVQRRQFVGRTVRQDTDIQMPFAVLQVCHGCAPVDF